MLSLRILLGLLLFAAFSVQLIVLSASPNGKARVYSGCTEPNKVALTFDDGPYIYENVISDYLDSKGVKATFFVNGYNYECIYGTKVAARLQKTYRSGHQICSHTWDHADLTGLSEAQIVDELNKIDVALFKILGINTTFVRPPYGSYDDLVRQVAYKLGKILITWDFDSGDSVGATVQQSEDDYDENIGEHVNNLLALNHETKKNTAEQLVPYVVEKFQAAGYELVTVAECLGLEPYTYVGPLGVRDKTWFCEEERSGN
ncbi:carbohydrate esterase family 4 protein [Favolaschia claudopus]|uniref:Carbohydrate esterase family 4 protein n=1 Tax=Favolaschia claudopus TaxID=2862362 RepID=A0AAW0C0V0_9AGAR